MSRMVSVTVEGHGTFEASEEACKDILRTMTPDEVITQVVLIAIDNDLDYSGISVLDAVVVLASLEGANKTWSAS